MGFLEDESKSVPDKIALVDGDHAVNPRYINGSIFSTAKQKTENLMRTACGSERAILRRKVGRLFLYLTH